MRRLLTSFGPSALWLAAALAISARSLPAPFPIAMPQLGHDSHIPTTKQAACRRVRLRNPSREPAIGADLSRYTGVTLENVQFPSYPAPTIRPVPSSF